MVYKGCAHYWLLGCQLLWDILWLSELSGMHLPQFQACSLSLQTISLRVAAARDIYARTTVS